MSSWFCMYKVIYMSIYSSHSFAGILRKMTFSVGLVQAQNENGIDIDKVLEGFLKHPSH